MEHYFGEVVGSCCREGAFPFSTEPQIMLSEIGKFADENLQNISAHYPYAEIPLFVIMPNHIHAIVMIDGEKTPYERRHCRDGACPVSTTEWKNENNATHDGARPVSTTERINENNTKHDGACPVSTGTKMKIIDNQKGWLSVAIGGFKSAVTKYAHSNAIDFAWQTRFYERIVRDQNEMNQIAEYIENNPIVWMLNKNAEPEL